MPNPWDVGSAALLHHLGFQALATTSAGMAFARGLPDRIAVVTRDKRLLVATLAIQALFIVHQCTPLLAPVA